MCCSSTGKQAGCKRENECLSDGLVAHWSPHRPVPSREYVFEEIKWIAEQWEREEKRGAVREESTRQLLDEQTLLWGFVLYAFCGVFHIAFRQFRMCKRNREIRSGWIKVCSASFITKHTLLYWRWKTNTGCTTCCLHVWWVCSHRALLAATEKAFFMASLWGLLLFSQKGKVCDLSRAEWITGGHSLEGLGLQDGRWEMALSAAQGFWEQCRAALRQGGAVCAAGSPVPMWRGWDSQEHPAHARSHCGVQLWAPQQGVSRITGYLCALSWPHPGAGLCLEAEMLVWCNGWALEVKIVSYCSISQQGLDPCGVVWRSLLCARHRCPVQGG